MKPLLPCAVAKVGLSLRPLPASALLICAGIGATVLIGFLTVALVPVIVAAGLVVALVAGAVACAWAGIEALAALERWMENDPRFHR